jgi:hypothetical protein
MNQCVTVFDVISTDQRAVVVFSRGGKFSFDSHGSGETGNWKVNPSKLKKIEKVLVYLRKPEEKSEGRIYIGDYKGYKLSEQKGRLIITFSKLEEVCQTQSKWNKFAKTGPSPVRYIN